MSENSQINENVRGQIDIIEDDSFSYDDFQVVRGEFFAHVFEPSITFVDSKVYVNTACIKKVTATDYVQILISKEQKKLVIRPCSEDERDSIRWCSATAKRTPKQVTCRPLFAILCDEMDWNPQYRYKFLGKMIRANNELLFLFDLTAPEIYLREVSDEGKIKNIRQPQFPEQWKSQFGIPAKEHSAKTKLNVFEGYTVIKISEDTRKKAKKVSGNMNVTEPKPDDIPKDSEVESSKNTPDTFISEFAAETASSSQGFISNTEHVTEDHLDKDKEQQYEQITLSNLSS